MKSQNILIRVFNDKYDMTYCIKLYEVYSRKEIEQMATDICSGYAIDQLGAKVEELGDLKTEHLLDYRKDAVLNNKYFQQ